MMDIQLGRRVAGRKSLDDKSWVSNNRDFIDTLDSGLEEALLEGQSFGHVVWFMTETLRTRHFLISFGGNENPSPPSTLGER